MINCVSFSRFGLGTMSPPSVSLDNKEERKWQDTSGTTDTMDTRTLVIVK